MSLSKSCPDELKIRPTNKEELARLIVLLGVHVLRTSSRYVDTAEKLKIEQSGLQLARLSNWAREKDLSSKLIVPVPKVPSAENLTSRNTISKLDNLAKGQAMRFPSHQYSVRIATRSGLTIIFSALVAQVTDTSNRLVFVVGDDIAVDVQRNEDIANHRREAAGSRPNRGGHHTENGYRHNGKPPS